MESLNIEESTFIIGKDGGCVNTQSVQVYIDPFRGKTNKGRREAGGALFYPKGGGRRSFFSKGGGRRFISYTGWAKKGASSK